MRVEGAAVNEAPKYTREKKSLLCTAAAAVEEPQYMRDSFSPLCTAVASVGIDASQFEPFYTVPEYWLLRNHIQNGRKKLLTGTSISWISSI